MPLTQPNETALVSDSDQKAAERDLAQSMLYASMIVGQLMQDIDQAIRDYAANHKGDNKAKVQIDPEKKVHKEVWVGKSKVMDTGNKNPDRDYNRLDDASADYLSKAMKLEKGNTSEELNRNVRVKVNGKMMFEVKDGKVTTNEFLERDRNTLSVEVDDPVEKAIELQKAEVKAPQAEPKTVIQSKEPEKPKATIGNDKTPAKPRAKQSEQPGQIVNGQGIEAKKPTNEQVKPITDQVAQMEERRIREKNTGTPDQIAGKLFDINKDMGTGDGSGHRMFMGQNIRLQSYGKSELQLYRNSDDALLFKVQDGNVVENHLSGTDKAKINSIHANMQKGMEQKTPLQAEHDRLTAGQPEMKNPWANPQAGKTGTAPAIDTTHFKHQGPQIKKPGQSKGTDSGAGK